MPCLIGLDSRMIRHTGIGTYVRGLLRGIQETDPSWLQEMTLFGPDGLMEGWEAANHREFDAPIYGIKEQLLYPSRLRRCKLWHAPHYNVPLVRSGAKLVVTIHDLIHWIFRKELFTPVQALYAGIMLNRAVHFSDHVIAVSENTKQDLIRNFKAPPEKVSVVYEAVEDRFQAVRDPAIIRSVLEKYGVREPYFLFVGSLKPHKNVLWLSRLFRELHAAKKTNAVLVLAGRKDKRYQPGYAELAKLESGGGIIHLPAVNDADLISLYSGAVSLIHPSRYEGFGLTLLEAMACETPVIALRAGSVPEVAGDAACLVDSCSDHGMMQAIIRMETAPEIRRTYSEKGRQQVKRFSWAKTAQKTISVYERVLSQA